MTTGIRKPSPNGHPNERHKTNETHGNGKKLSGSLGVSSIVFMVVAAAAPLTVIGGGAPIGIMLGNGAGFPATYIVTAVVLLLFAVGLSTMARFIPKAGAFFTYVSYGLSKSCGISAAFLALVTYTAVQIAVYGFIGAQLSNITASLGGPDVPWWVWSAAMVLAVAWLGYRDIDLSSKVLGLLLVAEIGIVLVLVAAIMLAGGAEGLSLTPFSPTQALSGAPGIGLMFAIAGFIGFEATAVFRDEAKEPEKTIPRATYTAIAVIGVFYAVSSWALVMAWGPSQIVAQASADPDGLIVTTTTNYLGASAALIVQVLLISSLFACVLSFHNVIARYQHAMAGARILPASLNATHLEHGSPHRSSLVQSVTALSLVVLAAVLKMDAVGQVFSWMSGLATLGVLVLMALTCLAVLAFFRHNPLPNARWQTQIAPGLGLVGLCAFTIIVACNFQVLIGGSGTIALLLGGLVPLSLLVGWVVARWIKVRRPEVLSGLSDAIAI